MYGILVILNSVLASVPLSVFQEDPMPDVNVGVSKSEYLLGEPIELKVTILNRSREPIEVPINYWPFDWTYDHGIHFNLQKTKLTLRPVEQEAGGSRRITKKSIKPNERFAICICLQRFILQPDAGKYRVPCELNVSYSIESPEGKELGRSVKVEGELTFVVQRGTPESLQRVFQHLVARRRSEDEEEHRAATEGLLVIEDPLVILACSPKPGPCAMRVSDAP